jgi:hypothetical protein
MPRPRQRVTIRSTAAAEGRSGLVRARQRSSGLLRTHGASPRASAQRPAPWRRPSERGLVIDIVARLAVLRPILGVGSPKVAPAQPNGCPANQSQCAGQQQQYRQDARMQLVADRDQQYAGQCVSPGQNFVDRFGKLQGRFRKTPALSGRPADRESIDAQRRLPDADRHALTFLAADADAVIEFQIVADHAHAREYVRAIADQRGAPDG